jgi:hypothetical protein
VYRLAGRVGGLSKWDNDPVGADAQLNEARRAFEARFESEQDRRLHFAKMALKSAQVRARKKKKGATDG